MGLLHAPPVLPVAARRGSAADASIRLLVDDGPPVGFFRVEGGKHRGAIGPAEGQTIEALVRRATDAGVPIVGVLSTSGADIHEGVASLHAWGGIAAALAAASGVVPIVLVVTGPCVSGPALLLGLADVVVMTVDAFAYVSGPAAVRSFTGVPTTHSSLGGAPVHDLRSGVASFVAADEEDALHVAADVLAFLPPNNATVAPVHASDDAVDRASRVAAEVVPSSPTASYDVRRVIEDLSDDGWYVELKPRHAPNIVTALGRIGGHPVGFIANQPSALAGTLDIEASQKAARFVQWCDAFGIALVSLVDTPGFQPGKDIEWRGMIRHGAELVHAYAAATVPRISVILRKAYGGAYIVMDSKQLGSDLCVSWPAAEIAVMGASGAVQILHGKRLAALEDPDIAAEERAALEADYAERYMTPAIACARGYLDDVIDPLTTRFVLASALEALLHKREHTPRRRHSNGPL
ncbi:MAG TPA: carboxyl transferase domain-containing protein [Acidimicrobiales bacterium]|jgi:acetyl-CoA carboxylase carboxyltransferase component|nr:carboxyl transferase domain-containing protein [Acidimicrobiales bacterium]